jgi:ketosteroid isomerase-like protein
MSPSQSPSPKELVQSIYAAFGRGDIGSILAALAGNVDWKHSGPQAIPFAGTYDGQGAVALFFQRLDSSTAFDEFVTEEFIAEGSRVVALGRYTAKSKRMGKSMTGRFAHEWTVANGKVTQFYSHGDTAAVAEIFS